MTYADSSFVVSLYIEDGNTAAARSYLRKTQEAVMLTSFSKSEIEHAIRMMAFRKRITAGEMTQGLLYFDRGLDEGRFTLRPTPSDEVFQAVSQLSNRYAIESGVRYMDMLHVAAAILANSKRFLTFDVRQAKLAKAVGLVVKP